jgi:hypothetical protein
MFSTHGSEEMKLQSRRLLVHSMIEAIAGICIATAISEARCFIPSDVFCRK